jgi:hypothetical protein
MALQNDVKVAIVGGVVNQTVVYEFLDSQPNWTAENGSAV